MLYSMLWLWYVRSLFLCYVFVSFYLSEILFQLSLVVSGCFPLVKFIVSLSREDLNHILCTHPKLSVKQLFTNLSNWCGDFVINEHHMYNSYLVLRSFLNFLLVESRFCFC